MVAGGAVDEPGEGIAPAQLGGVEVEEDEVGGFAGFEASADRVEAEGAGAVDGEHADGVLCAELAGACLVLGEEGGLAAFGQGVEAVVAGGTVGAEADGDASAAKVVDGGDAGAELEVGAGAVGDGGAALLEDGAFLLVHLDAVGEGGVGAEEAEVVQEGEVFLAVALEDGLGLAGVFGSVGVDAEALGLGAAGDFAEEVFGAGEDEAGVVGEEEAVVAAMVGFDQAVGLVEAVLGVAGEAGGEAGDGLVVHEGVAEDGADGVVAQLFEDGAGVPDALHALEGGAAAPEEFPEREAGGLAEGLGSVGGLHGPDLFAEPGEEGAVFGQAPEEGLAEVDVGLDEAREGVEAVEAPHFFAFEGGEVAEFLDEPVTNAQGALDDGGISGHGDEVETLEEQAAHFWDWAGF